MPKPKSNTDFRTGSAGILFPLIHKFFEDNPAPASWEDEESRWQRARFLAEVATDPTFPDTLYDSTSPIEFPHYYEYFVRLFQEDPDYFLKFASYIRRKMKVRRHSEVAKAFLREGAVERYRAEKSQEPLDKELSEMLRREHGISITAEHFGDARRAARREDQKVKRTLQNLGRPPSDDRPAEDISDG